MEVVVMVVKPGKFDLDILRWIDPTRLTTQPNLYPVFNFFFTVVVVFSHSVAIAREGRKARGKCYSVKIRAEERMEKRCEVSRIDRTSAGARISS